MFTSLSGRSVLVTGGSKGIGKGIAAGFASEGAKVVITGRDSTAGERTAAELAAAASKAGSAGEVTFVAGDVGDQESCQSVAAVAQQRHGGLDVVCCNAGIFPLARLEDMTARQLDEMLAINLKGTFFIIQAALPALRRSAQGRIIVISSITGPVTGFSGWSHYGASKAGQLGLVRTAALELAPAGITVNAILPGNIATESPEDPDYIRSMEAAIPQRHLGSVQDIASAALFFATDEARYITGQTLIVDGGQTLPESAEAMS